MLCKKSNLMWVILKSKYVEQKKISSYIKIDGIFCTSLCECSLIASNF